MRVKHTAKWGLQIAEMIFQTRSGRLSVALFSISSKPYISIHANFLCAFQAFYYLNSPFKKGGSHGEGQDCAKQDHHARSDVDVEVKFSVQQVTGSDQDCADGEVDKDGDHGAAIGFYGGGFVFPV